MRHSDLIGEVVSETGTDVVFEVDTAAEHSLLHVRRVFDSRTLSFRLRPANERITEIRKRLAAAIEPFRAAVGLTTVLLSVERADLAVLHLDRLAFSIVDLLLAGSGWDARQFFGAISSHLRPVFRRHCLSGKSPSIELRASARESWAWLLPLEFLPVADAPDDGNTATSAWFGRRVSKYLGFRCQVIRQLDRTKQIIPRNAEGRLDINIVAYQGNDLHGISRQLRFFRGRNRDFKILEEWPQLADVSPSEAPERLANMIQRADAGFLHLCCHFRDVSPNNAGLAQAEPFLEFEGESVKSPLRVRLIDLRGELARLPRKTSRGSGATLVFANACRSGTVGAAGESLVGFLREKRCEEIIGSEGLLPDRVAGEFSVRFYTALLRGATVGEAILRARIDLLERFRNPAGLLYTGYGNPNLTCERRH